MRCREPWTIIAFQDSPYDSSNMENFTSLLTSYEPLRRETEPLQNFWDLREIEAENENIMVSTSPKTWRFRSEVLCFLIWYGYFQGFQNNDFSVVLVLVLLNWSQLKPQFSRNETEYRHHY